MDSVGELAIQVSLVGHQAKWSGGEHLPTRQISEVLKRRYRKCPRIGHLDICRPSYGQKKGRESNWQFDSRPLKVGNRPLPEVRIGSAIRRSKDLDEGYNFGSDFVAIQARSRELWRFKVPGVPPGRFRDNSGLHFGSPGNLCHLGVVPTTWRREYYREYGGGILPSQGCGESK
ncbi:unnamed protein product [Sphagnum jensenii]